MLCPSPPCPPLPPEERGGTLLPSPLWGRDRGWGRQQTVLVSLLPLTPPAPLSHQRRGGEHCSPPPLWGRGRGWGNIPPFMGEGQGVGKQQTVLVSLLPLTSLPPAPTRGEGGNTAPLPLYGGGTGGGGISPLYGGGTGGGRDSRRFSSPSSSLTPLPPLRSRWEQRALR